MTRLRSDIVVAVLRRRAEAAGAFVHFARKGDASAGAIFLVVDRLDGTLDLYGPAPQGFDAEPDAFAGRQFSRLASGVLRDAVGARLASEVRFDPDLWIVEIEDRAGRPFVDVV